MSTYSDHEQRLLDQQSGAEMDRHVERQNTLAEALPREMARVRDQLMPMYQAIGAPGAIALAMMRADLDRAAKAMMSGDVVAMLRVYESLKGFTS